MPAPTRAARDRDAAPDGPGSSTTTPLPIDRRLAAVAGIVAVGAALGIGELAAGLLPGSPSPLISVAQFLVDVQPPGAKDIAVGLFGTNDKLALEILIVVVGLLIGAGIGILGIRHASASSVVIGAFAAGGFLASLRDPTATPVLAAIAAAGETLIGSWVLGWLLHTASTAPPATRGTRRAVAMPDWTRRRLLQRGGAIAAGSVAIGLVGRWLLDRSQAPIAATTLPNPAKPATLPAGADISTPDLANDGLTPIVIPDDQFYRIDTALLIPTLDVATWQLRIHGMVDRETVLTYDQLVQLPIIEQYVTIACVSNEVGGNLVGNAAWRGVPLRTVLDMAGVQSGASQLVGRSADGFTTGTPTEWVMDPQRTPMIAIGMNGQPLPREHGYPARLIIPGLYGYVSATKWLTEIEMTTLEAFNAYWINLGWAKEGPILTQSRIDVPRDGSNVSAGRQPIAGVAWAPDRGIDAVEISIDQGPWQRTTLSAPISKATWVQWLFSWDAPAGAHSISVRATDGTGTVQTDQQTPPAPDGARGHHTIDVQVG